MTHSQVTKLAVASGEHEALVLLLAYTGLRWGEAVGLRVRDLNMLRKQINISVNAVESGSKIHVGTPKTHKLRDVPLPGFLLDYLARACEGKDRDGQVFGGEDGGHLKRPHRESGWFAKAVAECRKADKEFPVLTPHDLRHTAASLAVFARGNVKVLQRMLGHKSAAMTLDIYAGLFDKDLAEVAAKLDEDRAREIGA